MTYLTEIIVVVRMNMVESMRKYLTFSIFGMWLIEENTSYFAVSKLRRVRRR